MTEERNPSDARADAHVSPAYRDLADERAPEHLDRTILNAAAKEARPRYSRFIAWTRPMAWAATIMLSVALVLEVTNPPSPAVVSLEEPVVPTSTLTKKQSNDMRHKAAAATEFKVENEDMLQQAEELARMQIGDNDRPSPAVSAADCDEEAIATPQTWFECIVALEAAGRDDAASEQRALLAAAFPDFDPR